MQCNRSSGPRRSSRSMTAFGMGEMQATQPQTSTDLLDVPQGNQSSASHFQRKFKKQR